MNHRQAGFSIIEMVISIMISAMLMTAALTIYNQISKGAVTVARITQQDTQMMILRDRLATDLQGLMPLWFTPEQYEKLTDLKKKETSPNTTEKTQATQPSGNVKRNNFLYAQSQNDQFYLLTFITTNALQTYGDKPIRTVRVVYLLQPDPAHAKTFKLMRKQEDAISSDFDLEKLTAGKFDQIAHKITHCAIEYGFIDQTPEQRTKAPEKPLTFKFVSQWGVNTQIKQKDDYVPALPDVLKLTIKVEYTPDQEPKTYELTCSIPSSQATAIKSFAEKKYYEEREEKKQPTAEDPVWRNRKNTAPANPIVTDNPAGIPPPLPVGQRG